MTAIDPRDAGPGRTTRDVLGAEDNRAGTPSTAMNRDHRAGDKVDQVSSVTLLGMAVVGSGVMLVAHWILG